MTTNNGRLRAVFLIGLLGWMGLSTLLGCASTGPQRKELLAGQVESFHHNLRWKRLHESAAFVTPASRDDFVRRYRDRMEDLQIDSHEVEAVSFLPDSDYGSHTTGAVVRVISREVELPDVTRRKVEREQTWLFLENN